MERETYPVCGVNFPVLLTSSQARVNIVVFFIVRFDIRGLSPGSSEDEDGIKEASELCENTAYIFLLSSANIVYLLKVWCNII